MKKNCTGKSAKLADSSRFSGLTLLRKSSTAYPTSPEAAKLEVFENLYPERKYEVVFDCAEFTSHCPVTGQPDFGEITIKYIPLHYCIESKSLKIFLFSFRNFDIFHEEVVNMILDRIVKAASPFYAEVIGKFKPRGGIAINVRAEYKRGKKYENT